ncbi:MAG: hypothetical protein OXD45_05715 [Rhodobacteraceae bacterium]|nr:hypothetical protein [Paracoccaceae bacterium]
MNSFTLNSPQNAESELSKVFAYGLKNNNGKFTISCRDESAFIKNKWFPLGEIKLAINSSNQVTDEDISQCISEGVFEWVTPPLEKAKKHLLCVLKDNENDQIDDSDLDKLMPIIASIGVRCCLNFPTFDPNFIEEIPYRQPTSIIVDTSGILQGGLDFVVKFLYPSVRVKVPGIVHMELDNSFQRFRAASHKTKKNSKSRLEGLKEHLKSQGGLGTLMRLELNSDTEIERDFLLGDPLRETFKIDTSTGLKGMNLSLPFRSYVDRLILESARRHQIQSGQKQEVRLLTSDQGLARMALVEGIEPLFFRSIQKCKFFGNILTGRIFHPFSGRPQSISLVKVLWELAIAFGSVKLNDIENGNALEINSIGKDKFWFPTHSKNDFLWLNIIKITNDKNKGTQNKLEDYKVPNTNSNQKSWKSNNDDEGNKINPDQKLKSQELSIKKRKGRKPSKNTFRRFQVNKLFGLVCALDDFQQLDLPEILKILETNKQIIFDNYRLFLQSGELIITENDIWKPTSKLIELSIALRNQREDEIHKYLLSIPSYYNFVDKLNDLNLGETLDKKPYGQGINGYRILGEITKVCIEIPRDGIYSTKNNPSINEFVNLAVDRFKDLDEGDNLVPTGKWLEALVKVNGIHPLTSRNKLTKAKRSRLIELVTEGSTTQIRNDRHFFHTLNLMDNQPIVEKKYLYRGDFLIPGKASVSLRIRSLLS